MFGEGAQDERLPHKWGVVPRACEEVLRAAAERATIGVQSDIAVAFVEIFGSDVTDLLANGANIGANEAGADNFFHAHRWVLEGRADVPISTCARPLVLGSRLLWRPPTRPHYNHSLPASHAGHLLC
eukprot:3972593-Pleurochrysis_carterae.AAC.4